MELGGFNEGFPAPPSLKGLGSHTGAFGAACPSSSIGSILERSKWPRQSPPLQKVKENELGERSDTKQVPHYSGRVWHGADVTEQMSVNYSNKYRPGAQQLALWDQGRIQGRCGQASNGLCCGLFYKQCQP